MTGYCKLEFFVSPAPDPCKGDRMEISRGLVMCFWVWVKLGYTAQRSAILRDKIRKSWWVWYQNCLFVHISGFEDMRISAFDQSDGRKSILCIWEIYLWSSWRKCVHGVFAQPTPFQSVFLLCRASATCLPTEWAAMSCCYAVNRTQTCRLLQSSQDSLPKRAAAKRVDELPKLLSVPRIAQHGQKPKSR